MSSHDDSHDETTQDTTSRRGFLTQSATVLGGTAIAFSLAGCGDNGGGGAPKAGKHKGGKGKHKGGGHKGLSAEVKPGEMDDYYGFWSGGQSGELRILGVPSMRELTRIPVFNHDNATGYGRSDWSKKLLKGRVIGDTHHVHLSYTDGTYDGRYVYVNDKMSARLARVRIATMETDAIVEIPNSQGTHGIFPQRHKTGMVMCNSEFMIPQPNDGSNMDDPKKYYGMHTAVDGEKMKVLWQVMVDGNLDLCATDYQGKYSFATCYNSEHGVLLEEMMAADQDWCWIFNLEKIQADVDAGKTITVGTFDKVIDGRKKKNNPYLIRVPVPKSPHGVNISPDGKYACCAGKLSPTVTVIDISKIADAFAGKIKPKDCIVAEPEVGLGPLHTAFDGKGNAFTSIFIDSVVTKWNIEKAIQKYAGKDVDPIIHKIDVHYQIGHINGSMSETKDADGQWIVALCKFSKDRFLPVGPLHPENDQLIDATGKEMRLVHDGPTYSEPHDAVIVDKTLIHTKKVQDRKHKRFKMYQRWAKEDGINLMRDNKVIRKGPKKVRVYMTSQAPKFGLTEIRVKKGDKVQVIVTNIDNVEDLTHGFCVCQHDVNMMINSQDTNSFTFNVPNAGLYWYYCTWFCHALHLEMRGRLIVEA